MERKQLKLTVFFTGKVKDALSGRDADGLTVQFGDSGPARPLSWASFRALLRMELADDTATLNGQGATAFPEATPAA